VLVILSAARLRAKPQERKSGVPKRAVFARLGWKSKDPENASYAMPYQEFSRKSLFTTQLVRVDKRGNSFG